MAKAKTEIQTVIMADNFADSAQVFGNCQALVPMGPSCFLDYTLCSVSLIDTKEVLIATSDHESEIKAYVDKYWSSASQPFKVQVVHCAGAASVGDVLRDLDSKRKISGDFLLLTAGAVFNTDLKAAVSEHKLRRKKDSNSVMTIIYRECDPNHPLRTRNNDALLMINKESKRIEHYQRLDHGVCRVQLPEELYEFDSETEIRLDLLDPNIAICSNQVPVLFSDNFDDQTRDDLIKEILINEEILGNHIHAHVVENEYVGEVFDPHTYLAVMKDILCRWTYPSVPERLSWRHGKRMLNCKKNLYVYRSSHGSYRDDVVEKNVLLGSDVQIGSGSKLLNCVIGDNCTIGANVKISNCILWDNVNIGDNCKITGSIVCNNVTVGANSTIADRCILKPSVMIAEKSNLAAGSLIAPSDGYAKPVGRSRTNSSSKACSHQHEPWPAWHPLYLAPQTADLDDGDYDDEEDSDTEEDLEDTIPCEDEADEDLRSFYSEVQESVKRSFDDNIQWDYVVLEINGSKHAYNINIEDVQKLVMRAILTYAHSETAKTEVAMDFWKSLKTVLTKLANLLKKYAGSAVESHCRYLEEVQAFLFATPVLNGAAPNLLLYLYENDVVVEEAILPWYIKLQANPEAVELSAKLKGFIEWLNQSDDESSDED